jgi:hypothetical protein
LYKIANDFLYSSGFKYGINGGLGNHGFCLFGWQR